MGRPLAFDRQTAIGEARRVFFEKGYEGASIEDLTAALGISRASLYNTFGDKRGLLLEAVEAACAEGETMRGKAIERRCRTKMIVRDFFRSLSGPETDGCFLLTLGAELADSDEEVKRRVGESLDKTRRMFVELLQREGPAPHVEKKAAQLVGVMVALLTLARVHPDRKMLEAIAEQGTAILD
jgi:TetR/AcrR family transcriptional repressor of nem operon